MLNLYLRHKIKHKRMTLSHCISLSSFFLLNQKYNLQRLEMFWWTSEVAWWVRTLPTSLITSVQNREPQIEIENHVPMLLNNLHLYTTVHTHDSTYIYTHNKHLKEYLISKIYNISHQLCVLIRYGTADFKSIQ